MSAANVAIVVTALREVGFSYLRRESTGWFVFSGLLTAGGDSHPCELKFEPTFLELPSVRLLVVPKALLPIAPHLDAQGGLCYIAKGTIVPDIFNPDRFILACLGRAGEVLNSILDGQMVKDLEEEFFAFWGKADFCCFSDVATKNLGRQQAFLTSAAGHRYAVVTDDPRRTQRKLANLQVDQHWLPLMAFRVQTHAKPRPLQRAWPLKQVRDVLAWQALLDPRCKRKIEARLEEAVAASVHGVLILVESPLMTYAFVAHFQSSHRLGRTLKSKKGRLYDSDVIPMAVIRMDDRYLAERNIPGRATLAGKNIVLVGCGTIGGYLADMLVKAGAGTGGGSLILVDPQSLLPENVGRHRLSAAHVFETKASALASVLKDGNPGAEIRGLPVAVQQAELGLPDIVIDATGEEALGHWMAHHFGASVPQLHVWIDGAGIAVRGLLRATKDAGCFRCLAEHERIGRYRAINEDMPIVHAGQGCEGLYVPFGAHVSVQAASLGAEMTLDWVDGRLGPDLRTRVLERRFTLATDDCVVERFEGCPACFT